MTETRAQEAAGLKGIEPLIFASMHKDFLRRYELERAEREGGKTD